MTNIIAEYQMNYIADANATAEGFNQSRTDALIGQGDDGKLYMKVDGEWNELPYTDGVKNDLAEEGGFVISERVYSCLSADGDMKPDVVGSWSDTITDPEK